MKKRVGVFKNKKKKEKGFVIGAFAFVKLFIRKFVSCYHVVRYLFIYFLDIVALRTFLTTKKILKTLVF